jgi:hypothetical protein
MIRSVIMKRYVLLILALASTRGFAATPIDETVAAGSADLLDVSNVVGRVTVIGSDQDEVRVRGTLSDGAEDLDVRLDGNRIVVHVIYPENRRGRDYRDEGTVLEISTPRRLDLSVSTVSADVSVRNVHGELNIESVSGAVETTLYESEIRANTVSGNIDVDGNDSRTRANVSSVSGRVDLDSVSGEVNAQTVSGQIDLRSGELDRAELKAVSGNIDVTAALTADGRLRALTTSGAITLDLSGSPSGRYELSSFSGAIDNCFGPTPSRPRFGPPSSTLQFEEQNGNVQIFANSMSGNIEVCK